MDAYDQGESAKAAAQMKVLLLDGWRWASSMKGEKYWERVYNELTRIAEGGVP